MKARRGDDRPVAYHPRRPEDPMHQFNAEIARQITESRIAQAEHARAVRGLTRSPRPGRVHARRVLGPIAHPGLALARLWRPE